MEKLTKMRRVIGTLVILVGLALSAYTWAWGQESAPRFELSFSTGGLLEDIVVGDVPFPQTFLGGLALGSGLPVTNPVEATAEFDLDAGYLYLFSVGYNFTKHFGGEFTIGGSTSNFGGDVTGVVIVDPVLRSTVPVHGTYSFDNNLLLLNADLIVQYPLGNFAPFLTLGVGMVYFGGELKNAFISIGEEAQGIDKAGFVALGVDEGLLEFSETSFQWSLGVGVKYYIEGGFLLQLEVKDHVVLNPAAEFFRGFGDTETLHLLEITGGIGITF